MYLKPLEKLCSVNVVSFSIVINIGGSQKAHKDRIHHGSLFIHIRIRYYISSYRFGLLLQRDGNFLYGANILANANADDQDFAAKHSFYSIFQCLHVSHTRTENSKGLFNTIASLHDKKEGTF